MNTDKQQVIVELDNNPITFETGRLARQAGGSCTARIGDTILFSASTASDQAREGIDFFPLTVEYREKFYAAGRFPGGFFKREARPSEKETLTARATDRPIRPLFPSGYYNEVQVMNLLLSADGENDSDVLSINAASASLMLSEIPFRGPVGCVRVGRIDGEFVLNPKHEEIVKSDLDLMYVGGLELPVMIEGSAKEVTEEDLMAAMRFAQPAVSRLCEAQLELRRKCGLPEKQSPAEDADAGLIERLRRQAGDSFKQALQVADKQQRQQRIKEVREEAFAALTADDEELAPESLQAAFDSLEIELVRNMVLREGRRVDGRGPDDLRALSSEVGFLPRTHGSALFNRGDTQALAAVTLGTVSDAQSLDAVTGGAASKPFMLHYNFPPYSVGEVRRIGSTSRREIGHGALAERSLQQVLPEDYPYTVRVVSEIMGSNGSSSMASICAGTLALMDAGVKISKPVAGISIGLFSDGEAAQLVTDILGSEDHCGDMDFKVAGTRDGVTGFQVDLKISGLRWDLVEGAFDKARQARMKILDHMSETIPQVRDEISPHAPRITQVSIDPDKIGALIGPGGKNVRRIQEETGAQIDIEDDGTVSIFSNDEESMKAAVYEVEMISAEAEVGKIYHGKVTGIKDFGAFVEILPGKDGLVHISEMADCRIRSVEDVCSLGEMMWVKCIGVDERGKIRLSRREALKDRGEDDEKCNQG